MFSGVALNLISLTPRFSGAQGRVYDQNRFSGLLARLQRLKLYCGINAPLTYRRGVSFGGRLPLRTAPITEM